MLQTLLDEEGLVCHLLDGQCHKVKLPRFVANTHLLAVGRNIENPDFVGYNRFVFGVPLPSYDWHVLCITDYGEMMTDFDRPEQGKAFIPPQSIKVDKHSGLLTCSGNFALQGLMHSLHQIASQAKLLTADKLRPRNAIVDGGVEISIGKNRSFQFEACDKFLETPVPVTLGCSRLWLLADEKDVHFQPPMILAMQGYGHQAYTEMPITTLDDLIRLAKENPGPVEAYRAVGIRTDPFLGLKESFIENMSDPTAFALDLFPAVIPKGKGQNRKRARV